MGFGGYNWASPSTKEASSYIHLRVTNNAEIVGRSRYCEYRVPGLIIINVLISKPQRLPYGYQIVIHSTIVLQKVDAFVPYRLLQ